MSKAKASGFLSVVVVMAVTGVYFSKHHAIHNKEVGEPVVNITYNISEPHKLNGTARGDVVYRIDDTDKPRRNKVKEVNASPPDILLQSLKVYEERKKL